MKRNSTCGLILCAVAVLCLTACGKKAGTYVPNSGSGPTLGNDPVLLTPAQLKAEAQLIGQPIYWAGPEKGSEYEFQRLSNGYVYVRYLPRGYAPGDPGKFPLVATYPYKGAYQGVKGAANGAAIPGPGKSVVWVEIDHPGSVLMAFPHGKYEIEVFNPRPAVARRTAMSGRVRPVG